MRPIIISWNITKKCNLNCAHCYRDAGSAARNELTTDEAFNLIDEIEKAGFKMLILSGGEPLIRKDIFEIIKYASDKRLKVMLGSNGTLITDAVAKKCLKAGVQRLGISVDSIDEKKHDDFRKYQGSFKKTLKGIENLKKANVPFQIHTTVTKNNVNEIRDITSFAEKIGAKAHHLFFLVSTGRASKKGTDTFFKKKQKKVSVPFLLEQISAEEQEKLLRNIIRGMKNGKIKIEVKPTCAPAFLRIAKEEGLDRHYTRGCLAGISYCVILPDGEVHPCPYLPVSAGNIRGKKFSRIWKESKIFNELRLQNLKGACGKCIYNKICGGCRAQAYAVYGDYLAQDPFCIRSEDGRQKTENGRQTSVTGRRFSDLRFRFPVI